MVSNAKRMRYVSGNEFSSSENETNDDADYPQHYRKIMGSDKKLKIKGKWLSKNAIMARQNRLRKKEYITNLEKEVGDLKTEKVGFTKVIESQSLLIADLKKEVKYLKSVIANSTSIGSLIKSIHQNTGMSVTTSLDQTLSLNVSKPKQPIARKTAHPWEETRYPSFPTPESDLTSSSVMEEMNEFNDVLLNDVELNDFLDDNFIDPISIETVNDGRHLQEHNYTTNEDEDEDVGVCLHVSKNQVSLEFCSTCSNSASPHVWND